MKGFGTLIEEVIEWNENESFTLSLSGLPRFVQEASGGWRLAKTGPNTTVATTHVALQTRWGLFGAFMEKFMLKPNFKKTIDKVQLEFKSYVEKANAAADKVA